MHDLRILFYRLCNDDAATFLSPADFFKAVTSSRECKSVQLSLNNYRQEDVHALFLKLLDYFVEQLTLIFETFSLSNIFNIHQVSVDYNEDAQDGVSQVLDITSPMDTYFIVENIYDHTYSQCTFVREIEKKSNIINASQLLVLHLSRFTTGF